MVVTDFKKSRLIILISIGIAAGLLSAFFPLIALAFAVFAIYISFFNWLSKEKTFKNILLISLIFMIFQDTLISILIPLNKTVGESLNNIDELLILLLLPLAIFLNTKNKIMKIGLLEFLLLVIIILGIFSSILNGVPFFISSQGALLMMKGFLIFFIFKSVSFEVNDLLRLRKIFISLFIVVLIGAIIDLFASNWLRNILNTNEKFDYRNGIVSVQSIFIHPGVYGWFMVFIGLYFISLSKIVKNPFLGVISASAFFFAFLSFRFKVILTIAGVLIYSYLRIGFRKAILGTIPISLVLLLVWYFIGEDLLYLTDLTIDRYLNPYYLDSARKALYVVGFLIGMEEFPFGVGWGRFGGWIARINYSPVYYEYGLNSVYGLKPEDPMWATDTYWPYIMGEIGLLSTVLLLSIFIFFLIYINKGYKVIKNNEKKIFLFFSILVIIQSLVESLGEQIYNSAPQYFYIFGVIGISISIINNEKKHEERTSQ